MRRSNNDLYDDDVALSAGLHEQRLIVVVHSLQYSLDLINYLC